MFSGFLGGSHAIPGVVPRQFLGSPWGASQRCFQMAPEQCPGHFQEGSWAVSEVGPGGAPVVVPGWF